MHLLARINLPYILRNKSGPFLSVLVCPVYSNHEIATAKSQKACCKRNRSGFCRNCACVKARKTCTNCFPMKLTKCANGLTAATGASYVKQPIPRVTTLVSTATKDTTTGATKDTTTGGDVCINAPQPMSRLTTPATTASRDSTAISQVNVLTTAGRTT